METRPKIKLTLSTLDIRLEWAGKILLVVMWSFTVYTFIKLPTTIPVHFNASGQANDHGSKFTLLILPIIGTIIYVGLTELNKYPHIFNYMTNITGENAKRQYTIATRLLRCMKSAILLIFSLIILFIYLTAMGVTIGLGFWFLPLTEGLLLIPVAIAISKSLKKENKVI